MATLFPLSTYTITDKTQLNNDDIVARDLLDDGDMRIRVLSFSTYQVVRCVFEHLSEVQARTFINYLKTNRATEFDMVFSFGSPDTTYRGYIWSDPKDSVSDGILHTVSFDFRGVAL